MRSRISISCWLIAGAILWFAPAGTTAAPPATQPDGYDAPLTAELAARLTRLVDSQFRYAWGEPIVERFDAKPARPAWQVQEQATIRYADGRMKVQPTDGQRAFGAVLRALPQAMHGRPGGRIDVWLTVPQVQEHTRLILFLHEGPPQRVAWDFAYYFAYAANGGEQILAQWLRPNGFRQRRWSGRPIAAGQLVHVVMQVVGPQMMLARDDGPTQTQTEQAAIPLTDETRIGLAVYRGQADVVRIDYRPLEATADLGPAAWKETPFAGREQFETWLERRAIRQLADPRFAARQQAGELFERLAPLAEPVLRRVAKTTDDPELRARLAGLLSAAAAPTASVRLPRAVVLPPPSLDPPTTQPD